MENAPQLHVTWWAHVANGSAKLSRFSRWRYNSFYNWDTRAEEAIKDSRLYWTSDFEIIQSWARLHLKMRDHAILHFFKKHGSKI